MAASDGSPAPARPKRKKKIIVLIVVLALLMAVAAAGYAAVQTMMGPAEGVAITDVPVAKSTTPPVELEQYDGTSISFVHPSSYKERPTKPDATASASLLETHTFISSGMVSKILTLSITKFPSGQLKDDASYYMRTLHPERYKITERVIKGDKVAIAANTQEYQLTAFWPHAGKMLTFSLSGVTADTDTVNAEYNKMLDSVVWR